MELGQQLEGLHNAQDVEQISHRPNVLFAKL